MGRKAFPYQGHLYGTLKGVCKLNVSPSFPVTLQVSRNFSIMLALDCHSMGASTQGLNSREPDYINEFQI